jgi:hypothetical protein
VDVQRAADQYAQGWTLRADNAGSRLLIFVAISQVSARIIAKPKRPLPALIGLRSCPELCPGAPVCPLLQVTVRGSSGARGDCSAKGTYVARGIDSAHSEVVRGTP